MILEITLPRSRLAFALVRFYMNRVIPFAVRLMSGRRRVGLLMHYYWDTIESCVPPEEILETLRQAGFTHVRRRVELGIFSEYHAELPSARTAAPRP